MVATSSHCSLTLNSVIFSSDLLLVIMISVVWLVEDLLLGRKLAALERLPQAQRLNFWNV